MSESKVLWWNGGYSMAVAEESAIDLSTAKEFFQNIPNFPTNEDIDVIVDENVRTALERNWKEMTVMMSLDEAGRLYFAGDFAFYGNPDDPIGVKTPALVDLVRDYLQEYDRVLDVVKWVSVFKECVSLLESEIIKAESSVLS